MHSEMIWPYCWYNDRHIKFTGMLSLQNIDTLERRAGVTDDSMVEAHGGYSSAHCMTCGAEYSAEFVKGKNLFILFIIIVLYKW